MNLNLSKKDLQDTFVLSLSKKGFSTNVRAKVNLIVDGSYSMDGLYSNGTVDALVKRVLTVANSFDDDGSIDVFTFASRGDSRMLEPATQATFESYRVPMLGGNTEYATVVERMADFYSNTVVTKRTGLFGLFGKKSEVTEVAEGRDGLDDTHPVFSIFITDGDTLHPNSDRETINRVLRENPDTFIMFVGINNGGNPSYKLVREISQYNKNAGFFDCGRLDSLTDEDFFNGLLSDKAKLILDK